MPNRPSTLPRAAGWTSLLMLGGLLRFAIFVPLGIYDGYAQNHWNVIKKNTQLQGGLYSPSIAAGEKIAAKWGRFAFYWSFAAWLPSVFVPPPVNIIFGIIDFVIAIFISIATHHQTGHVPHDIKHCKGSGAHSFQLPPGANESFFEAAARLNATATNPFHMCKSFVQEWRYGIVISIFYSAIALFSIIATASICLFSYREAHGMSKSFFELMLYGFINLPKYIGAFIVAFLYYIPVIFFRCLPISVKSKVRLVRRYGVKAGQGLEEKGEMQMHALKRKIERKGETDKYTAKELGEPTNLGEFLSIYDVLIEVVQHLHYVDVVNLGLVSKSVREAVLPADEYEQRMTHFKMYACHNKGKKQCWVCNNQICRSTRCKYSRALKQTTLYFHLDNCRPYCTPCYLSTVHSSPTSPSTLPPTPRNRHMDTRICRCAPVTATPNILQRYLNSTAYYSSRQTQLPYIPRSVCRECNVFTDKGLLERRETRTKWELKHGGRKEGLKCKGCEKILGGGPRWWVCRGCKRECRSWVHGAWGSSKSKGGDVEVVGEQAV